MLVQSAVWQGCDAAKCSVAGRGVTLQSAVWQAGVWRCKVQWGRGVTLQSALSAPPAAANVPGKWGISVVRQVLCAAPPHPALCISAPWYYTLCLLNPVRTQNPRATRVDWSVPCAYSKS